MNLQWIQNIVNLKTCQNYSIEQCRQILDLSDTSTIPLQNYILLVIGTNSEGNKEVCFLRVLGMNYHSKPLLGSHYISVYAHDKKEWHNQWVYSLFRVKSQLCGFKDKVSFERTAFIILPQQQKLIRIKSVRSVIALPVLMMTNARAHTRLYNSVSYRTRRQAKNIIQLLFTSYCRDLGSCDKSEIKACFKKEILAEIEEITS